MGSSRSYDTIVVGAGIAGICTAYWLKERGQRVLLIDKRGVLGGASGAAGAFLSPRIGRGGDLQKITNEAYRFALGFYGRIAPEAFFQSGLVRIPKDGADARKFEECRPFLDVDFQEADRSSFPHIDADAMRYGGLFFPDAAYVDPFRVAEKLISGIDTAWGLLAVPRRIGGVWRVERYAAPSIVLATGADRFPLPAPYLQIGALWGERVDLLCDASVPVTLHRHISVSSSVEGIVRIGATHVRGGMESEAERIERLVADARSLVPALETCRIHKIFGGFRSAVNDHFPIAGGVVDFEAMKKGGESPTPESLPTVAGAYAVGAFGGRGFVFAPLVGEMVANVILGGFGPDPRVSIGRFPLRLLKRRLRKGR